jgi:plasmid stabilization system protein ParE
MKRRLVLTEKAIGDMHHAFKWYERNRKGLGELFFRGVDEAAARVLANPALHLKFNKSQRRALMKRFPYALYYRYDETSVYVVAILHLRRDPETINNRLREAIREFER